ncbi:hypothetical protein [Candidatus Spongiihabitans sp.]|uniref:hypothetical protein n=1 Tax=Candidatus Spongiihabitans sp. TaxID=3101308 RepID=UPI003C6FB4AE
MLLMNVSHVLVQTSMRPQEDKKIRQSEVKSIHLNHRQPADADHKRSISNSMTAKDGGNAGFAGAKTCPQLGGEYNALFSIILEGSGELQPI